MNQSFEIPGQVKSPQAIIEETNHLSSNSRS